METPAPNASTKEYAVGAGDFNKDVRNQRATLPDSPSEKLWPCENDLLSGPVRLAYGVGPYRGRNSPVPDHQKRLTVSDSLFDELLADFFDNFSENGGRFREAEGEASPQSPPAGALLL